LPHTEELLLPVNGLGGTPLMELYLLLQLDVL
jgi:dihydroxyacetone kinase